MPQETTFADWEQELLQPSAPIAPPTTTDEPPPLTRDDLQRCCNQWSYRNMHLYLPASVDYVDEALERAEIIRSTPVYEIFYTPDGWEADWYDYYANPDRDLYGRDDTIREYNYRPRWQFHGSDSKVYLGAEIEVEAENADLYDGAEQMNSALGNIGFVKSDGSLDCGMEIVTHPMTYQWAMDNFPWQALDDLRNSGFDAYSTCGIHVHVNRAAFDNPAHVYKWLALIYRNPVPIQALADRGSVEYCSWNGRTRQHLKDHAKGSTDEQRYVPVNVQNTDTYEVRIFAGSVYPLDIQAALAFVDASVEYARQLTAHAITARDGWSFAAFKQWVVEQKRWAPLVAVIDQRVNGQADAPQAIRPRTQELRIGQRVRAARRLGYIRRGVEGTVRNVDSMYDTYFVEFSTNDTYPSYVDTGYWVELTDVEILT